jgi:hypothetical protein
MITFVVAISSLMASTHPFVSNPVGGRVLAVFGIVAAAASIATLIIEKVLVKVELEATRYMLTNGTSSEVKDANRSA